jgi:hypothetical protein
VKNYRRSREARSAERHCLGTTIAPRRRATFHQTLLVLSLSLFQAVDDSPAAGPASGLLELPLQPGQALVDALPAGRDQVDEESEIVDTCVPLGQQIALEVLEPSNRLIGQPAHLGKLSCDRVCLGADAFADCVLDLAGKRGLDVRGELGERLDLSARPLEGGIDVGGRGATVGRLVQAFPCPCDRAFVHVSER